MKPVDFPNRNFIYQKPPNMTDEECSPLPVFKGRDEMNYPVVISCWDLSEQDMEQLRKTGKIYLMMYTAGPICPVCVTPFPPFKKPVKEN